MRRLKYVFRGFRDVGKVYSHTGMCGYNCSIHDGLHEQKNYSRLYETGFRDAINSAFGGTGDNVYTVKSQTLGGEEGS